MSNKMQRYTDYFIWKLLYMYRVVPTPIIVEELNLRFNSSTTAAGSSNGVTNTRFCRYVYAPDDGCWYQPKHVEQFPDKINCVTLHLVGHILEYSYDARTH
jgi:hypothetical protein